MYKGSQRGVQAVGTVAGGSRRRSGVTLPTRRRATPLTPAVTLLSHPVPYGALRRLATSNLYDIVSVSSVPHSAAVAHMSTGTDGGSSSTPAAAVAAAVPPTYTPGSAASPAGPQRGRGGGWVCPECGKRFLGEQNLRQHRRQRHLVKLPSEAQAAAAALSEQHDALAAELAALEQEAAQLRRRIDQRRRGKTDAEDTSSPARAEVGDSAASSGAEAEVLLSPTQPTPAVAGGARARLGAEALADFRQQLANRSISGNSSSRVRQFIGTGISQFSGVGRVVGTPLLGHLEGPKSSAPSAVAPVSLLQFDLHVEVHRERRPGQQQLHRTRLLVRHYYDSNKNKGASVTSSASLHMREAQGANGKGQATAPTEGEEAPPMVLAGDLLVVEGAYRLHRSYDATTKRWIENPCVHATRIGLLARTAEQTDASSTDAHEDKNGNDPTTVLSTSEEQRQKQRKVGSELTEAGVSILTAAAAAVVANHKDTPHPLRDNQHNPHAAPRRAGTRPPAASSPSSEAESSAAAAATEALATSTEGASSKKLKKRKKIIRRKRKAS